MEQYGTVLWAIFKLHLPQRIEFANGLVLKHFEYLSQQLNALFSSCLSGERAKDID